MHGPQRTMVCPRHLMPFAKPLDRRVHCHVKPTAWGCVASRPSYYDIGGPGRIHYRAIANDKREKRVQRENAYMSVGLEAKSVKGRYMRVAAIVIVTREGSRDICGTE